MYSGFNMVASSAFASSLLAIAPLLGHLSLAQSTGTFDFLTYNVAGLPEFLTDNGVPGDKATNARTIGSKLAQGAYDIVHLQEVDEPVNKLGRKIADWTGLQLPL